MAGSLLGSGQKKRALIDVGNPWSGQLDAVPLLVMEDRLLRRFLQLRVGRAHSQIVGCGDSVDVEFSCLMIRLSRKAVVFFGAVLLLFFPLLEAPALSAAQDTWEGVERVVAIGDVHGDYEQFLAALRSARLIDSQESWSGGKTHLIQTGDILDRGPDSRKVMDLLMKLEKEARRAGGWVHCLIGNHEAMNIYGDLRYVSPGEFAAFQDRNSEKARAELYKEQQDQIKSSSPPEKVPAFDDAFQKKWEAEHPLGYAEHRRELGPTGKYGKWIRSHNAVIKIDNTLFLHGGIGPKYVDLKLRMLNERVRDELEDFTKLRGGIVMDEGPLWYRGWPKATKWRWSHTSRRFLRLIKQKGL